MLNVTLQISDLQTTRTPRLPSEVRKNHAPSQHSPICLSRHSTGAGTGTNLLALCQPAFDLHVPKSLTIQEIVCKEKVGNCSRERRVLRQELAIDVDDDADDEIQHVHQQYGRICFGVRRWQW